MADDLDGTMRVRHDRLCDASEHQPLQTSPSVRPHDNQIRLPFIGRIHNRRTRIALANGSLR